MINSENKLLFEGREISTNQELIALYRANLSSRGFGGTTVGYDSEEQHLSKISQCAILLSQLVSPSDSVLDIGCGYGSLIPLLPECRYHGIDLVPEFVEEAQKKYPSLSFEVADLHDHAQEYDWCLLVGVISSVPSPETLIIGAWEKCRKGLLIDFTDSRKFQGELNCFNVGNCLNWFLDMGAKRVEVFPTHDIWTIFTVQKSGKWKVST